MPCTNNEFKVADMPSLTGYIVIVTGGNSGIGYETSLQLAQRGARVYIASRSADRVKTAMASMKKSSPAVTLDLHFLKLDLQDLQSVKGTAAEFLRKESQLDILVNNAGIMASPYKLTKDGHETQWQTCFLAHHAFTLSLLPALRTAAQKSGKMDRVRIVNVACDAAFMPGPKSISYDDPNMTDITGVMASWKRYGHCKQASIIAAKALTDHYRPLGITAYSLHPGIIKSGLQSHDTSFMGAVTRVAVSVLPTSTPADGARTSLFCATSPEAVENAGRFFAPVGKVDGRAGRWLDDEAAVGKLWDLAGRQLEAHGFEFVDMRAS